MSYGAMLTDQNGVPFYIDGTMPLTLLEKRTVSTISSGFSSVDLYRNDGTIRFTFILSNGPWSDATCCEWLQLESGIWRMYYNGSSQRTVEVYIFGYKFQPIPAWGIQINDAQGRCILTNETKVLRDVQGFGNPADNNNSGYTINQSLTGKWAVLPQSTGLFTAVLVGDGQTRPVTANYWSSARYNGSQTKICSGYRGSIGSGGGIQNPTYTNSRTRLFCINVARY